MPPRTRVAAEATPVPESPDAIITSMTAIRAQLAERLPPLEAARDEARRERRDLILGKADESAVTTARDRCRVAEAAYHEVADAIEEAERRLAGAEEQRAAERAEVERKQVAAGLERGSEEMKAAAAGLAKAIDAAAKAHAVLALSISNRAAGQFDYHVVASPVGIANLMLLEGLVHSLPGLEFEAVLRPWSGYLHREPVKGVAPAATASDFAERLRETAAKVRLAEVGPNLPEHYEPQPNFNPDRTEKLVYVTVPFSYQIGNARTLETAGTQPRMLPEPVADRAIERGFASMQRPEMTDAGPLSLGRVGAVGWDEAEDLDFDLAECRAAEAARQRGAWEATQTARAA